MKTKIAAVKLSFNQQPTVAVSTAFSYSVASNQHVITVSDNINRLLIGRGNSMIFIYIEHFCNQILFRLRYSISRQFSLVDHSLRVTIQSNKHQQQSHRTAIRPKVGIVVSINLGK
jgi:hypothetical protein